MVEPYGWEQDVIADRDYDEVASWVFDLQIGFGDTVTPDHAYDIVSKTHEYIDEVREADESFPDFTEEPQFAASSITDAGYVHPGAAEYYREQDQWDDSWQEAELD
jgi:TRAP-type uncharacterized transport system substrate-binding protein